MSEHVARFVRAELAKYAGVGFDAEVGGVVLEAHTCPECGKTETRAAQDEEQQQ